MLEQVDVIYLIEDPLFFRQYAFHQQKIAFHRASMKAWVHALTEQGKTCRYISSTEPDSDVRNLIKTLAGENGSPELHVIDPVDDWLTRRIMKQAGGFNIPVVTYESPLFLNTKPDLSTVFRKDKKSFFQTTFYKQQRKKLNILLEENGTPQGGKWTYDSDNRKKYPKGKTPPAVRRPEPDPAWSEAVAYTQKHFKDNPGSLSASSLYPLTHDDAQRWLQQFLDERFHDFGAYEDAIVQHEGILHHSLLSPLLNVGLLSPRDVLTQSLGFAKAHDIPINSTEGFVRQIIGWREFIRGMYECKGVAMRTRNFWGFDRKIPASFYDGSTGIEPVDATIRKVLETGYCHHIERLMILGNFMLLCEFDPDEVYRWFMELFIDAYDWVMVPNVYGMSQFADGGLFATKPYISSSNYVRKMSDYTAGKWQCIWDGLFWRFIDRHKEFFKSNPRLSMLVHSCERMTSAKRDEHISNADRFLQGL
jgi:deoxyribodipyrimidine photolyase-related protein